MNNVNAIEKLAKRKEKKPAGFGLQMSEALVVFFSDLEIGMLKAHLTRG